MCDSLALSKGGKLKSSYCEATICWIARIMPYFRYATIVVKCASGSAQLLSVAVIDVLQTT